jgi:hypothetical protein
MIDRSTSISDLTRLQAALTTCIGMVDAEMREREIRRDVFDEEPAGDPIKRRKRAPL